GFVNTAPYHLARCGSPGVLLSWSNQVGGPAMPTQSPFPISLSPSERETLEHRARKYTLPYFTVLRAKIILLAADGWPNDAIAAALWVGRDVISLWRKRFFHDRLPGLEERPRSGRPRAFPPRGGRSSQGNCL